jgi:hypothetical protein
MNVRRGLWRIWIFLTVLWVIGTAALAYMIMPDSLTAGHVKRGRGLRQPMCTRPSRKGVALAF